MKTTTILAAIARNKNGEILLVEQVAKYDSKPNWMLPGGKLESGEDIYKSLKRELLEETGLNLISIDGFAYTIQIFNLKESVGKSSMFNVNVFEVSLEQKVIKPQDPDQEILQAAYFSASEAISKLKNNKFSYTYEPSSDCIKNFPNNYKFWEYHWRDGKTDLVSRL